MGLLAHGEQKQARSLLSPRVQVPQMDSALSQIGDLVSGHKLGTLRPVAFQKGFTAGTHFNDITYEAHLDDKWLVADLALSPKGSGYDVLGVHAAVLPRSLEETNAFTLVGKRLVNYLVLLLACASVAFIFFTLIRVIRTPGIRRWPWILGSVLGVGVFKLNWTLGIGQFHPLSVNLFGAGISRTGTAGPWILSFGVPIFAILFHVRRRSLLKAVPESTGAE